MQSLRQILARESERNNLKSAGFCVGVVLILVVITFAMVNTKFSFNSAPAASSSGPSASEVRANY